MKRLIVYGGSFDPVHNAHIRMAKKASEELDASLVFVPAASPRWKNPGASAEDRLNMLRLVLDKEADPRFSIDACELEREGTSYTVDTIRYLKDKHKDAELYLLIGGDSVNTFHDWKDAETIASLCKIAFIAREGVHACADNIKKYGMIPLFDEGVGEVSSTEVRNLRDLDVDDLVISYIEEHGLYYMKELKGLLGEKRLRHSVSVARLSKEIAEANRLNGHKAYVAGLIHDIGKYQEDRSFIEKSYPEYADYPKWSYHQFIAVHLAKERFGITDPEILEAIEFHCTGSPNMSPLGKIVYAADKIEPGRGYDSSGLIKSCIDDYEQGFIDVLEANREFLKEKGSKDEPPLTTECYKKYLRR